MAREAIVFDKVSIVFGDRPRAALRQMDDGLDRAAIQERTGQILGVHDCSLTVAEGEISVLMGLSGSGKSTLLRAVNRLNPVTRGSLMVRDGNTLVDVAQASEATLGHIRQHCVSMVFQQFALLPWRTVIDNVALGLEIANVPPRERRERAHAELKTVNLADWADRKVSELSGGMQQRVGLARAFATDAPILLMDEPFSALDPLIRNKLQDELLELQERKQRTILFVSHDLEEAVKIGNTITILEGGRIVQSGRAEDIVLKPADDYVAEFVAHLNLLPVLRVRDVMREGTNGTTGSVAVDADAPIVSVIETVLAAEGRSVAVMGDGAPIGHISAGDILGKLSRTAPPSPPHEPD